VGGALGGVAVLAAAAGAYVYMTGTASAGGSKAGGALSSTAGGAGLGKSGQPVTLQRHSSMSLLLRGSGIEVLGDVAVPAVGVPAAGEVFIASNPMVQSRHAFPAMQSRAQMSHVLRT